MSTGLDRIVFTLDGIRRAYADGVRPVEIVEETFRRIDAAEDPGIFLHLFDLDELKIAAEALGAFDPEYPLWGIPFAVKDNIDIAGAPTTAACPAFSYVAETDAFAVTRLRDAGAIVIGKTNLDQFATGLVGVRTPYPVPRNALDPMIVPGGSSSGSAVAVARGIVPFALGTDTAGSGRVPAGLNNIVGLKPTLGAISSSGVVPACRTLDTISIFAQTVGDAYSVLQVAAGYDAEDAYSRPVPTPDPGPLPTQFSVGIPDPKSIRFDGDKCQADAFATTVSALKSSGASIVEIDFGPFFDVARMLYDGAWVAEREVAMADLLATTPEAVHPVTREIVAPAQKMSATDAFRGIYRLADLKRKIQPALAAVDLLCVPTMPRFVAVEETVTDPIGPNAMLGTYTNFVNLLDMSGLAVPTTPRTDGRPGSVTLLADTGHDSLLASLGRIIEQFGNRHLGATEWPVPLAKTPVDAVVRPNEIEIAVCGAHMSGLPLNGELTQRHGRFLRATRTTPEYRLYALPGGPPHRPGMVRTTEAGGAIDVEVWALPSDQVGGFLAGIPSPLGLGKVTLADDTTPIGFVCEAVGAKGAEDVTSFGSWRAFLERGRK